jgi:hypothetical protein
MLSVGQWRLPVEWLKDLVVGEHKRFTLVLANDFYYRDENNESILPGLGRVHEMAFAKNKVDSKVNLANKAKKQMQATAPTREPLPRKRARVPFDTPEGSFNGSVESLP